MVSRKTAGDFVGSKNFIHELIVPGMDLMHVPGNNSIAPERPNYILK
jgi:hypothetical protein